MKLTRTISPTILLLLGVAAAQPVAPPPAPDVAPARPAAPPRPAPRAWLAESPDPPLPPPALADFVPEPPLPPQAPAAAPAAPQPPAPTQTPAVVPAPAPRPVPAVAPEPPIPPIPPDLDFRIEEAKERLFELKNRFDFDFDYGPRAAALAAAQDKLAADMAWKFDGVMGGIKGGVMGGIDSMAMAKDMAFAPQVVFKGRNMSDDRLYEAGQRALDGRRWDEALEDFNQVAARAGSRADGAWYWKAYTLNKLGRRDEALAAIAELRKSYASSHWLDDAKALELEVKQGSGQRVSPEAESDEELKLLALNGLMQSDPERAFPLLENLLKSAQSPRLKKNAVYVLAQSNSPKASQLLEQVARGQGNPDLQLTAIRYLGEKRRQTNGGQLLADIYASSNDVTVKRAIIGTLESARDKDRLLQIAKTEKSPELRMDAIRNLGGMNSAQAEMWQLFQSESDPQIRQQILESMPQTGNLDKFLEIARTDKDVKLRRQALQNLSSTRAATTGDTLVTMYASEQDPQVKNSIIDALYSQRNAKALVAAARAEKDARTKQRIVERLVNMKSPEATDYLMEILK